MSLSRLKASLRSLAYALGLLGWWHRRRNADALTVFMFHRVLPRDSAAYAQAEKEFTFTVEGFGRCLDFMRRHYSIVTAAELAAAIDGKGVLPPCPAVITFDDGWRDTLVHACPQLKARDMKALVFLATEILETPAPQWWQDMLVQVLDNPPQAQLLLQKLGMPEHYAQHRTRDSDHEIAGRVAALPLQERLELLAAFVVSPPTDRQMLTQDEVRAADRRCIEFGAHGHTHAPLTAVAEAEAELRRSHALVAALDPAVASMSFPHGAYTDEIVGQTEAAGFSLVFTSDPVLLDMRRPGRGRRIGRIHVPENEWTTEAGHISFPKLATFLFFRPQASS